MKTNKFISTFLFMLLSIQGAPALSAESLQFGKKISRSSAEKIKYFTSKTLNAPHPLEIASSDLNNDGLNEFITRSANCPQTQLCTYTILAESQNNFISLGQLEGANILLGNEFTHGVRNLLLFNNPSNDFEYRLYTWHPQTATYKSIKQ